MEVDKTEELQRSIDAVLAKIEANKLTLGSLFQTSRAETVMGWREPAEPPAEGNEHRPDRWRSG